MRIFKLFCFAAAVLLSTFIRPASAEYAANAHTNVELLSEYSEIASGTSFWAVVRFNPDEHWHLYWKNPGDSGFAPKITWNTPEGFQFGAIQWPYPERIDYEILVSYGYKKPFTLLIPIKVSPDISHGNYLLQAKVQFLACETICVPGEVELKLDLPVTGKNVVNENAKALIEETKQLWPVADDSYKVKAQLKIDSVNLFIETPKDLGVIEFFPLRNDLIDHIAEQSAQKFKEGYKISIPKSKYFADDFTDVEGVLVSSIGWDEDELKKALSFTTQFSDSIAGFKEPEKSSYNQVSFLAACLLAFLGGLILNLMPCVLPVLSIKVLGLINHAEDRKKAWQSGLVFTFGVLVSFWFLAGLLIALKAGGEKIGWGFQFQNPWFIIFMAAVIFLISLNLFGVFEVGASLTGIGAGTHHIKGLIGSFVSGILATVVATPCTAPFMGTAISFALSQSAFVSLSIFTFLGLGLAFPYLLLTYFPMLLKFVPKPGPWMRSLKIFLGILMLATTVWLLWVLGMQLNSKKTVPVVGLSYGLEWENYSPEIIKKYRREGRVVFLDFTAAWCITCQFNEKTALSNRKVLDKFKELNVAMIKADWTNYDESVTQALAEFGRNSIPLYVIYYPKKTSDPILLPELLTADIVLDAFKKIQNLK